MSFSNWRSFDSKGNWFSLMKKKEEIVFNNMLQQEKMKKQVIHSGKNTDISLDRDYGDGVVLSRKAQVKLNTGEKT